MSESAEIEGVEVVMQCEPAKITWHNIKESGENDKFHSMSSHNVNGSEVEKTMDKVDDISQLPVFEATEFATTGAGDDMEIDDQSEVVNSIIETQFPILSEISLENQFEITANDNAEKHGEKRPALSESLIEVFPLETPYESDDDDDVSDEKRTFHCEICDCSCTGKDCFDKHLVGSRHAKNVKNKEAGLPMAKGKSSKGSKEPKDPDIATALARCKDPIIGLKNVVEWIHESDVLLEPTYSCELCTNKFDLRMVTSHLTGRNHRMNYMKENYYTWYKEINEKIDNGATKQEQSLMILERVEEIIKLETPQTYQSKKSEGIPPNAKRMKIEPDPSQVLPPVPQLNGYVHDFDRIPDFYPEFETPAPQVVASSNTEIKKETQKSDNSSKSNKKKIAPLLKSSRDLPHHGRFDQIDNVRSAWGSSRFDPWLDSRLDSRHNSQPLSDYDYPPPLHSRHSEYDRWSEERMVRYEQYLQDRERFYDRDRNFHDRRERRSPERPAVVMRPSVWVPSGELETAFNGPPLQLEELMRKIIKKLDDDTICTDEEAKLAQQVIREVSNALQKYKFRTNPSKDSDLMKFSTDTIPNQNASRMEKASLPLAHDYSHKGQSQTNSSHDSYKSQAEVPSLMLSGPSSQPAKGHYTAEIPYHPTTHQISRSQGHTSYSHASKMQAYHNQNVPSRQSDIPSRQTDMPYRSTEMPIRHSDITSQTQNYMTTNPLSHNPPKVPSNHPSASSYGSSLPTNARAIASSQQHPLYPAANNSNSSQFPKPVMKNMYPEVGTPGSKNPYSDVSARTNYPLVGAPSLNPQREEIKPAVRLNNPRLDYRTDPRVEMRQDSRDTFASRQNYTNREGSDSNLPREILSQRDVRNSLSNDFGSNAFPDRNTNTNATMNYSSPLSQLHLRKSVL